MGRASSVTPWAEAYRRRQPGGERPPGYGAGQPTRSARRVLSVSHTETAFRRRTWPAHRAVIPPSTGSRAPVTKHRRALGQPASWSARAPTTANTAPSSTSSASATAKRRFADSGRRRDRIDEPASAGRLRRRRARAPIQLSERDLGGVPDQGIIGGGVLDAALGLHGQNDGS